MCGRDALRDFIFSHLRVGWGVWTGGAKLNPLTESGGGSVQEKEKALLAEIITRVNDLFEGELTEDDRLV